MSAYSRDLRQRVIDTVERKEGSLRQIASRFLVSISIVTRLLRLHRDTGSVDPRPHGGGRPAALGPADLRRLREVIADQPDATLEELRQRLGVACSIMAISRALRKLKITRKKKDLHAQGRDSPAVQRKRRAFRREVAGIDPQRLVFVDESGANTAMTRTYGRAPVGKRVHGSAPGHWNSVTLICGLRLSGVTAPVVFQGATDTAVFETYVRQALVPQLQAGDVVIWDNLKPHKDAHVKQAVERTGARVEALPPYSSDLTPIEGMWSKAKGFLRSVAARTTDTLYDAMGAALRAVDPEDIVGWFRSCGWCGGPGLKSLGPEHSTNCRGHPRCSL